MPIYQFHCSICGTVSEEIRRYQDRDVPMPCTGCGSKQTYRIWSAANINIWSAERKFPNLSNWGDGSKSFPSKAAYEQYLKDTDTREISQGGIVSRPHGNRVVATRGGRPDGAIGAGAVDG